MPDDLPPRDTGGVQWNRGRSPGDRTPVSPWRSSRRELHPTPEEAPAGRPAPWSHESRARREAVGRPRARRPSSAPAARRDGYFEGRGYQVTWALGHLATLKEPQDYDPALKRWSLAALPFIPERFELKPLGDKGAGKQFAVVKRLFRSADELICATDAGREGELIFRYILELAGCTGKPARRLWLSSLTEAAIRDAFAPPAAAVRLRRAVRRGPLPERGRLGRRPERDPLLHRPPPRRRPALERRAGADAGAGDDRPPRRRDPHVQARAVLGAADPLPRGHVQVRRRPLRSRRRTPWRSCGGCEGHPFTVRGVERKPERVQPPQLYDLTELQRDMNRRLRDVGRRHAEGGPVALRGEADQLPEDRLALPGRRHEGEGPGHPGRAPGPQAGRDRQAGPRRPRLHRADHQRREGERPPRDHPHRQAAGGPLAGGPEGLRRRRHPPDRRLLPRLREGGDDRRRGVQRGAVPGQGGAGARAGLDRPVPPQGRRQEGRRAGAARVPPRRERPARAVRPAGRDDAAEALHRGDACWGRWRRPASWSTTSS